MNYSQTYIEGGLCVIKGIIISKGEEGLNYLLVYEVRRKREWCLCLGPMVNLEIT